MPCCLIHSQRSTSMAAAVDRPMDSLAAYMQGHLSLADYEWPQPHLSSLAANASHHHFLIPEIDLQSLLRLCGDDDAAADRKQKQELAALLDAASTGGFFQVYNHGVPVSALETLHSSAKKFFSRPLEQKLEVEKSLGNLFEQARYHTGYTCGTPLDSPVKWWLESLLIATSDKRNVVAVTECLGMNDEDQKSFVSGVTTALKVGCIELCSILMSHVSLSRVFTIHDLHAYWVPSHSFSSILVNMPSSRAYSPRSIEGQYFRKYLKTNGKGWNI